MLEDSSAQKLRENSLSNSQMRNLNFYIFQLMKIHEENDPIYTNLRGQIVVEIVGALSVKT
jgi:hypothetical protein